GRRRRVEGDLSEPRQAALAEQGRILSTPSCPGCPCASGCPSAALPAPEQLHRDAGCSVHGERGRVPRAQRADWVTQLRAVRVGDGSTGRDGGVLARALLPASAVAVPHFDPSTEQQRHDAEQARPDYPVEYGIHAAENADGIASTPALIRAGRRALEERAGREHRADGIL